MRFCTPPSSLPNPHFGPHMALAYRLDAISQGQKNSRIPGPNPLPLALVMDMHASKTLCTGLFKSLVHRWFYEHENPLIGLRGPDGKGGGEGEESEGEKQGGRVGG